MSSKMQEALEEMADRCNRSHSVWDNWRELTISEIAQRYGDLEFTWEEARGMLQVAYRRGHSNSHVSGRVTNANAEVAANEILSRHTEAEGDKPEAICGDCGRELEEVRPGKHQCTYCEIVRAAARDLEDRLTKRVAAIENRLLADGHSRKCKFAVYIGGECTCHHDEIRENIE